MKIVDSIENWVIRRMYRRAERFLTTAPAEEIVAQGQRRALESFHRAARQVPAYGRRLAAAGIAPETITTLEEFRRRVPIVDKVSVFTTAPLRDLCTGGTLDDIALFYSSSGQTGVFSFGVCTRADLTNTAAGVEFGLNRNFDIFKHKTLLINALPMGVKVPTRTLPLAETSVRADVIATLIKGLAGDFEQFILIGEHLFLKKVIEEGADAGVPWRDLVVHALTGGEFVPEGWRRYIGHLLGTDCDTPGRGLIVLNMGLSELTLSIFQDSLPMLRIRRAALKDRALRYALFGEGTEVCPEIMQYNPLLTFLETEPGADGQPELVVTLLDRHLKLPLIRYNTRDVVRLLDYGALAAVLRAHGHAALVPPSHLPVGLIRGKDQGLEMGPAGRITVADVKESLYRDFAVAGLLTGFFRLMTEDGRAVLLVQLRRGRAPAADTAASLTHSLAALTPCPVDVRLVPFEAYPYGLDLNYEVKPRYL
jgi:phenylacetate-CoA ligase